MIFIKKCLSFLRRAFITFSVLVIALMAGLVIFLVASRTPPTQQKIEQQMQSDLSCIQIMCDFLMNDPHDAVIFHNAYEPYFADFEHYPIEDPEVEAALKYLFEIKKYKSIFKLGNKIQFEMWSGFIVDRSCGIAFALNNIEKPDVQYVTTLVPLESGGWYYYICDYEEWRLRQISEP